MSADRKTTITVDSPKSSQFSELKNLWIEAFGDSEEFLKVFEKTAFSPDRCRCITLDGNVVAALYWFDCSFDGHKIAYVYAVATAKAYQGQGLCRTLMENTHAHLQSLDYKGVILVPGNESLFRFYANLGYEICSYIREFACENNKQHLGKSGLEFIREIDKINYAILRPQFLPAGAVIQENENLDFLETTAKFYIGGNFLLAASIHENNLVAMELLGDPSCAPEIVQALDCKKGTFRTPGTEKPFSMYYSLENTGDTPQYFGFAFD